ncbi:MAG: O-antigen ligase family protein [Methyloprofundus sp.]|nr:O-antigen ligase family protein [Methyloprofundus sp.]
MTAKIPNSISLKLMTNILTILFSLSLGLMPALVLTIHHGDNIAAISLFILSLIHLTQHRPINFSLNTKEKILILSLVLLPIIIALDVLLRDLRFKYLDYYLRFILVIPIYFSLRQTKINLKPFFIGLFLGAIGAGLFAIYQSIFVDVHNVRGYIMKINFGNLSLLLGVMGLAGLFLLPEFSYKKTLILLCLLSFGFGLTASILSGTRGGWIATPFFVSLFLVYFPASKKRKLISIGALAIILIITYTSNAYFKSRTDAAYSNAGTYLYSAGSNAVNTSEGIRFELWKAAWLMFTEQPIFGVGSGQFNDILKEKIDAGEIPKIQVFDHAHSEPLQILATTGIIGFLSYIFLYAGIAYYFYSFLSPSSTYKIRYLSILGLMLVGGFLIFGLTNYSFGHQVMVLFFAVMAVSIAGMIKSIEAEENTERVN